jgi:prepilin-type N-terminal cleavage/methylation domain-containing protein
MKRRFDNARGFTLIEILIASAIMAVVLAALYGVFFTAYRATSDVNDSLIKLQEARAFMDTLKREIESSLYVREKPYCVFKLEDRDYFGRQTSSLLMTTSSPLIKGLTRINYAVEERDGALTITKKMASAFSQTDEGYRVDLIENVESFSLQAKQNNAWIKTWDSTLVKAAPEEVQIVVTIRLHTPYTLFETAKLRVGKTI